MTTLKLILTFIISITIGFGSWYLVGWFLSNEANLFLWPVYGKLIFLIFGTSSSASIADTIVEDIF